MPHTALQRGLIKKFPQNEQKSSFFCKFDQFWSKIAKSRGFRNENGVKKRVFWRFFRQTRGVPRETRKRVPARQGVNFQKSIKMTPFLGGGSPFWHFSHKNPHIHCIFAPRYGLVMFLWCNAMGLIELDNMLISSIQISMILNVFSVKITNISIAFLHLDMCLFCFVVQCNGTNGAR